MLNKTLIIAALCLATTNAFSAPRLVTSPRTNSMRLFMSEPVESTSTEATSEGDDEIDPMEEEMDESTRLAMEKMRRADELRAQEVFMTKSTGKFGCTNCDWVYDETKGDTMMIGGMVKPGTTFEELPSNWRCPVCRASKDSFKEELIEIPGFEVNQGYGFGTNSMTAGQKNGLIFGGLGFFFVLFLSGYAMN
jgi:rubredoxin